MFLPSVHAIIRSAILAVIEAPGMYNVCFFRVAAILMVVKMSDAEREMAANAMMKC